MTESFFDKKFMESHILESKYDEHICRIFREYFMSANETTHFEVPNFPNKFIKCDHTSKSFSTEHLKAFSEVEFKIGDSSDIRKFCEKRTELLNLINSYKSVRESAVVQTHYVNRQALMTEIRSVKARIANYEKEELLKVPSKVRGENLETYKAFYQEQAKKMVEVLTVKLSQLETLANGDKNLQLDIAKQLELKNAVKVARKQINNKCRFFKKYQLNSNGKLLKTAGIKTSEGTFFLVNLSVRVSST